MNTSTTNLLKIILSGVLLISSFNVRANDNLSQTNLGHHILSHSTLHHQASDVIDGSTPDAGLIQGWDGNFYGITENGGSTDNGTVFRITPDGQESVLYSFLGADDGANPAGELIQGSDGNFYGTTLGDFMNVGTFFRMTPDGTESVLNRFSGTPSGVVEGYDGNFYVTTLFGGLNSDNGAIFEIESKTTLGTLIHSFTNNDGAQPAALIRGSDGNLYGTTFFGGGGKGCDQGSCGTVFKITLSGKFYSLYAFKGGLDGDTPEPVLIEAIDGNFYGTTRYGGKDNMGTIFRVTSDGKESVLYSFNGSSGAHPRAGLIQGHDWNFYGTTEDGGDYDCGAAFKFDSNGKETVLHSFKCDGLDGVSPMGRLMQAADGNFYGTTTGGGASNRGTVYKITPNGQESVLYQVLYRFGSN